MPHFLNLTRSLQRVALNLPNHFKQHMVVCGLSLHLGSSESRKTLEKKLSSISAPLIPTESTSTFHSTNLFLFSCHHIPTNGVAPLSAYKNAFMVFKKLEIKFSYLAFILFHKLSVLILESLDFELHCQRQVTVSELTDLSVRDVQKNIKYP